ncbi:DUF2484 family protein [Thalassovita sp.]|uniref:DUF2484 family protein n=1 Tax=Thalassovita sp. TaxID=1979401 RepID=UPI002B26D778|nr:DUF2484 family protein [Thalassovita sp.]
MSLSFGLACGWLVLVNILGLFPSKRNHWPQAYAMIALGVPILIYLIYQNGPWMGLLFLASAMSVLRWPVIYLGRWIRRQLGRG